MVKLNLSSQIVLNKVPEEFYHPKTAVELSELTRCEKLPTTIFPKTEEGALSIATTIANAIRQKQQSGQYCVLGLGTGSSLTPVFNELIRLHKEEKLSFSNVVVFNAYEYFPLQPSAKNSTLNQLKERLLNHIDINPQNVFTLEGTVPQERVQESCRLYEQRIQSFGGIDIMLLGIGRIGNIAINEPGSSLTSSSRLILIDSLTREEMSMSQSTNETVPPCAVTMACRSLRLYSIAPVKQKLLPESLPPDVSRPTILTCLTVSSMSALLASRPLLNFWLNTSPMPSHTNRSGSSDRKNPPKSLTEQESITFCTCFSPIPAIL